MSWGGGGGGGGGGGLGWQLETISLCISANSREPSLIVLHTLLGNVAK